MSSAPKQWSLTKFETIFSIEAWKGNLEYRLSLDDQFRPFLNTTWEKWSKAQPLRGLTEDTTGRYRKTAAVKARLLELLLGQVANYCPVISRNTIVRNSTSLNHVWQLIRAHYGFQASGAQILDLSLFKLENDERYEDLFQRITAFCEDNMITQDSNILHHGEAVDEDTTPLVENIIVVLWLQMIHPDLPALVKQRYGTELRNKSLASLKPEISLALNSLVDEVKTTEDGRIMRTFTTSKRKYCVLCKAEGRRYDSHYIRDCKFLPVADKRHFNKKSSGQSRRVVDDASDDEVEIGDNDASADEDDDNVDAFIDTPTTNRRVGIIQSPSFTAFYGSKPVVLTLNTGATTNMILFDFAKSIGLPIIKASQLAKQADGVTPLTVRGEVHCKLSRDDHRFVLDALVVDKLDCDVLAGTLFMDDNDIGTRPAKKQIIIRGSDIISYGSNSIKVPKARRAQTYVLRGPTHNTVVMPGEYIELDVSRSSIQDTTLALEPRYDSSLNRNRKTALPHCQEIVSVGKSLRITNSTDDPILVRKNEHMCQVRPVISADTITPAETSLRQEKLENLHPYSYNISLDPDKCLDNDDIRMFNELNRKYDNVFNPSIAKYNGASGPIQAVVNIGPSLPPQRKGRLPNCNREKHLELQQKFDDLEKAGVFAKPEDVGVNVEYLNLSFLVQKPHGGTRLVTSFGEVAN